MDKYEFFREATLRICSSLDIEKVMCRCVGFLKIVIPADKLILTFYDQRLNAIRTIASATPRKGKIEDDLIQMPLEINLPEQIQTLPREHICNDPEKEPLNKRMASAYGLQGYSILQMFLETQEQKTGLGHLTLCAKGKNRYTQQHLDLFKQIKEPFTIAAANIFQHYQVLQTQQTLEDDKRYLQKELHHLAGDTIIGLEGGLKDVMKKVRQVASKLSPVLLTGETGVGKDIIANTIHALSNRRKADFIKVNCGAIPDALIDSELFGHEKGAFTGAVQRKRGRFERANKGTIFLDEVGELPLQAQVRFLRVLQNKEIERVGGSELVELDIRVIAATNKYLENRLGKNEFREDLWYRLNVFPIHIPPLRQRKMDIVPLVKYFIKTKSLELQLPEVPELRSGDIERLMNYHWPGNVRELENIIERALIVSEGDHLQIDPFFRAEKRLPDSADSPGVKSLKMDDVNIQHIEKVLEMTNGKIHGPHGAARILGINAGTLRNRMSKLGIVYGRRRKKQQTPK